MTTTESSGRVAVVTGAAGGIGAAVVLALASTNVSVAAVDRDPDGLRRLVTGAPGLPVFSYPADVTSATEVGRVVDAVERDIGPIEFLVNGAGILRARPVLDLSEQDWEETFAVNAGGVFRVSTAVARRMAGRKRGAIVSVASNAAGVPRTQMAAYGAAKAAVTAFTKNLGLELACLGIRCNVVAPGSTDTPMLRSLWHDDSGPSHTLNGSPEEYRVGIPLGKLAQPADIADAVLFLLSDRAGHITMHDLYVDGGAALGR
ncbi:2,3-dihydro-2,3-dihydroxybenzoate dehydrogenase [Kutzneria sp. CA-103260]|uniref:2,3-dihydro-2,3-dihydroxybenzoate dehydrogenase n=1 Tax=Kutzneria sp. CA-103260 TaxID=2802641 RepID=UPI001BA48A8E|nr:2,3-dihydro-2,3-dihydroxybenzoate dehydrogenase [Kutzneria sp. CA-103260]QUQ64453.1 2,3-dihydro-2,3-dihydroxybenzoate dehydrogenase [Kutzneria sp. CA-103260]